MLPAKHTTLTIVLFIITMCQAFGQLAIKAGPNLSIIRTDDSFDYTKTKLRGQIEATYTISIYRNIFLESGTYFAWKGTKVSDSFRKGYLHLNYLELPLIAKYSINWKGVRLFLGGGICFNKIINENTKVTYTSRSGGETTLEHSTSFFGNRPPWPQSYEWDYGINVVTEVIISNAIIVSLEFEYGIRDVDNSMLKKFNRMTALSFGYQFQKTSMKFGK